MKWLISVIILTVCWVYSYVTQINNDAAEQAYQRLSYTLELATHAASLQVQNPSVGDGNIVFDQSSADSMFRRLLAANMKLDPTTLQPLPGSLYPGPPDIRLEQFVDYSNATFPYHYINSTYGINVELNGPAIIYDVSMPAPHQFASSQAFNMPWSTVAAYPDTPADTPTGNGVAITGVQVFSGSWPPTFTVTGSGFGTAPAAGQQAISLNDVTRNFTANNAGTTPQIQIQSWTDTSITFSLANYGGADFQDYSDGDGSLAFWPGDNLSLTILNPQVGMGSTYTMTYPTVAEQPTLTLNPVPVTEQNASKPISGTVSFNGVPLSNQAITVSVSAGTFTSGGTMLAPNEYVLMTDSNGNFRANWTAPSTAQNVSVTVSGDGTSQTDTVQVIDHPYFQSISWNTSTWPPQLTINGLDFGTAGDSSDLTITDNTRNWSTAQVQPTIPSWTDTQIQIANFQHYADSNGWLFAPGDSVTITVKNPQTGNSTSYNTTYPSNAPMPKLTINHPSNMDSNESQTISGTVLFNGQGLANQVVTLSASTGTLSSTQVTTDANGNWSTTFQAPSGNASVTISGSCDTSSASTNFSVFTPQVTGVSWNTGVWPPQLTVSGNGLGTGGTTSNINVIDNTRGWTRGAVQYTINPWNDNQITITNFSNYGGGNGSWIFAPGDSITVQISNPQTGLSTSYNTTYPTNATMPVVAVNNPGTLTNNQTVTISGTVKFKGVGIAGQYVSLTANTGSFPNGAAATTDSNGNWSVTYQAPNATTTATVTASSDTSSTSTSFSIVEQPIITGVSWNTGVWPPQVTVSGSGFGGSANYVQIFDNSRGWQGGTTGSAVLLGSSWSDTSVTVNNMSNYGGGGGSWLLAPNDSVTINITNQWGRSASYSTTYPGHAQMPVVGINQPGNVFQGQSETITGNVTFNGAGIAGQTVNVSVSGGSLSSSQVTTDGNGNWSVRYTANNGAFGTVTIYANSDTSSASASFTISTPPAWMFDFLSGYWPNLPSDIYQAQTYDPSSQNLTTQDDYWENTMPQDVKWIGDSMAYLCIPYGMYGSSEEVRVLGAHSGTYVQPYSYFQNNNPTAIQDFSLDPNSGTVYMAMADGKILANGNTQVTTTPSSAVPSKIDYDPADNGLIVTTSNSFYFFSFSNYTWYLLFDPSGSGSSYGINGFAYDPQLGKEVFNFRGQYYTFNQGSTMVASPADYMFANWGGLGTPSSQSTSFIVEADTGNLLVNGGNGYAYEYNVFSHSTQTTISMPYGMGGYGYNPNSRGVYFFSTGWVTTPSYDSYNLQTGALKTITMAPLGQSSYGVQMQEEMVSMGAPYGG